MFPHLFGKLTTFIKIEKTKHTQIFSDDLNYTEKGEEKGGPGGPEEDGWISQTPSAGIVRRGGAQCSCSEVY